MKKKIFVTVGSTYPFDRLIKEIDTLGKNKSYEIFAQIGETKFKPKNIEFEEFLEYEEIQNKINWADIVISHAGVGTIIDCISKNKKLILSPRLKKYKEAIDDHQVEIAKAFEKKYKIKYTLNEKNIVNLLNSTKKFIRNKKQNVLVNSIKELMK